MARLTGSPGLYRGQCAAKPIVQPAKPLLGDIHHRVDGVGPRPEVRESLALVLDLMDAPNRLQLSFSRALGLA
jgi:hypothetical protein